MKNLIALLTMLFSLIANSSLAQSELQAGQKYAAGSSVKSTYFGISTRIPNRITAAYNEQEGKQVLGGGTPEGNVAFLMLFQYGLNAQSYQHFLSHPLPIGQVNLQPVSDPQSLSVQTADLERGIVGQTVVITGGNTSLLLIVFGMQGKEFEIANVIAAFRTNTKFGKSLAGNGDTKARKDWTQLLTGKLLVRSADTSSNSQNGLGSSSSDTRMALCSNQAFQYNRTSSISISVPDSSLSDSSSDTSQGRWTLEYANQNSAILTLTDESGLQTRMNLRIAGGFVVIDGQGWRISNTSC
jgi:hypothetical protein